MLASTSPINSLLINNMRYFKHKKVENYQLIGKNIRVRCKMNCSRARASAFSLDTIAITPPTTKLPTTTTLAATIVLVCEDWASFVGWHALILVSKK